MDSANSIIIISQDANFSTQISEALKVKPEDVVIIKEYIYATVKEILLQIKPNLLLVDADFDPGDKNLIDKLKNKNFVELSMFVKQASNLPRSFLVLNEIDKFKRENNLIDLLIFYFIDNPGMQLTQILLKNGADWVWPSKYRREMDLMGIIDRLRIITKRSLKGEKNERVLVVENSRETCKRIKIALEDKFIVDFVGDDKAGYDMEIDSNEAIRKFVEKRYDAVLIDLALKQVSESYASEICKNNVSLTNYLMSMSSDSKDDLLRIFGGLLVIKEIFRINSDQKVVVMSNYVKDELILDIIKIVLEEDFKKVERFMEKDEKTGFKELKEYIQSIV